MGEGVEASAMSTEPAGSPGLRRNTDPPLENTEGWGGGQTAFLKVTAPDGTAVARLKLSREHPSNLKQLSESTPYKMLGKLCLPGNLVAPSTLVENGGSGSDCPGERVGAHVCHGGGGASLSVFSSLAGPSVPRDSPELSSQPRLCLGCWHLAVCRLSSSAC